MYIGLWLLTGFLFSTRRSSILFEVAPWRGLAQPGMGKAPQRVLIRLAGHEQRVSGRQANHRCVEEEFEKETSRVVERSVFILHVRGYYTMSRGGISVVFGTGKDRK